MTNRVRPDIHQMVAVLSTRLKQPNDTAWEKLVRMINYLNGGNKRYLTLSADDLKVIKWYMDKKIVVLPNFKSHNIVIMTMVQGLMQ